MGLNSVERSESSSFNQSSLHQNSSVNKLEEKIVKILNVKFVWDFMLYQHYFSYLAATVHKPMFPGPFLTSPLSGHWRASRNAIPIILSA